MLREISDTRQIPEEPVRRWFTSAGMDLFVWLDDEQQPAGFQFTYVSKSGGKSGSNSGGSGNQERAVVWKPASGLSCMTVDDGEIAGDPKYKATPTLSASADVDTAQVCAIFEVAARDLPPAIREFVAARINNDELGRRTFQPSNQPD